MKELVSVEVLGRIVVSETVASWRHVFKLDPDRLISDDALARICESGTDAIMIGGSTGITYDNTSKLLTRVRPYKIPCVLEVSNMEAIVPGFDLYMVPSVINSTHPDWMIGQHQRAVKEYGTILPWDKVVVEGYIVLHANCAVARLTKARTNLDREDVIAYAQVAERLFHFPIVYLEYSGTYGDMELVQEVRMALNNSRLFYGGGITNAGQAEQAAKMADTIVVGNVIYDDLDNAIATVKAVKNKKI